MLQALQRGRHAVHHALHAGGGMGKVMLAQHVGVLVKAVIELWQGLAQPLGQVAQLDSALGRHGKGQNHAGKRCVHAGLEHAEPQHQAQQHIGRQAVVLRLVERHQRGRHHGGAGQPEHVGTLAVEHGDGHDGDKVVRDGEGREEHAHAVGHAVAEQREHAQGKGDVGCHGDGPAADGAALVQKRIDAGGRHHAAHGRKHRQHGLARVGELAHRHLVLKLDAHQQKEDGHEEVVDKDLHAQLRGEGTEPHVERLLQKVMDGLVQVGVGANHGGHRGKHHDGSRDGAVRGHAVPQVVALQLFSLGIVEQLLAGIGHVHGRLLF